MFKISKLVNIQYRLLFYCTYDVNLRDELLNKLKSKKRRRGASNHFDRIGPSSVV